MVIEDPTFGCGTFLPGMGPGNFPEFDGGGGIDGGGGDDDDGPGTPIPGGEGVDPTGQEGGGGPGTKMPPATGTGPGPTGGGAGGGGPGSPTTGTSAGRPGSTTGGGGGTGSTPKICKCVPVSHTFTITETQYHKYITITFNQDCKQVNPGGSGGQSYIDSIVNGFLDDNCSVFYRTGVTDNDCKQDDKCNGPCDLYKVQIHCRIGGDEDEGPGEPIDGGSAGNPTIATGGGIVQIDPPAGVPPKPKGGPGTQIPPPPGTPPGPVPTNGGGSVTQIPPPPKTPPGPVPGDGLGNQTGAAISKVSEWTQATLIGEAVRRGEINLNDPTLISMILRKKPTGIEDSDVAFIRSPQSPKLVPNNSGNTQLFNDFIDSNVEYVLSNRRTFGNWDSRPAAGVTRDTVYNSLKPEVKELLKQIRNYDGTPLTKNQIFSMIGTRILDGTVAKISLKFLQTLANSSKKREPVLIKRSNQSRVNEVAALALVDHTMYPLDPTKANGLMKNILPNWKTLASDVDKYIEINIGGVLKKYYIKDDNTFIDRSTLSLADGDYFNVKRGAITVRFFVKSEIDHAFLLPEKIRQKAIKLLGGEGGRTLKVSSDYSSVSGFEFDYSLSTPRQDFYMLSCVLSSINTKPNLGGSFLLKDSTARYELMDTSTTQGLQDANEFIKYKANHRVFMLDDSDIMLDHVLGTSALTVDQTDILFDSPKENKTIPLLTRQIPWYIMLYPTNRNSLNIFNSKSKIIELDPQGKLTRQLRCKTTIVPNLSKQQTNKFIRTQTQGKTGTNVLGEVDLQARITQVTGSDTVFKTGYKQNNKLISAQEYVPSRKKTGVRLLKEIITELDTNYELGLNGIGKSLTEFDVYSRLTLPQFNVLSRTESFDTIQNSVRNGLIANVKMIPPIRRADKRVSFQKTQLVQRKVGVPSTDTFVSIKGTNNGQTIIPPTTTSEATFGPITR